MRRILIYLLVFILLCPTIQAAESEKYVALTFDDGPSGRFTQRLLEGLEQRGVKATFLLCGYRLKDYPATAQAIFDAGHEIGLHGYSHKDMGKMNYADAAKEIADTLTLLPAGCRPVFLRPPGGSYGAACTQAARDAGLALLGWSVDPRDWCSNDAAAVEAAVVTAVRSGDVILLHDMSDSSVDAALAIVDSLLAQGFRFVTVSELAAAYDSSPTPGTMYNRFP